jgi:hypothetical protein
LKGKVPAFRTVGDFGLKTGDAIAQPDGFLADPVRSGKMGRHAEKDFFA